MWTLKQRCRDRKQWRLAGICHKFSSICHFLSCICCFSSICHYSYCCAAAAAFMPLFQWHVPFKWSFWHWASLRFIAYAITSGPYGVSAAHTSLACAVIMAYATSSTILALHQQYGLYVNTSVFFMSFTFICFKVSFVTL